MALIEIHQLCKSYRKKPALDHIDLSLNEGQIVGLLGPNGSGKTTLLKILAALTADYTGEIRILGHKPGLESKALLSFLPEITYLNNNMRAQEYLQLFRDFYSDFDLHKAEDMLKYFQIEPPQLIKEMSKGMKEKLQIALVMSRQARIYLLDEPISGVDPASRSVILEGIIRNYSEQALVIISTHLIQDVESVLDSVVFLNQGRVILQEQSEELRAKEGKSIDSIFREVFRCLPY